MIRINNIIFNFFKSEKKNKNFRKNFLINTGIDIGLEVAETISLFKKNKTYLFRGNIIKLQNLPFKYFDIKNNILNFNNLYFSKLFENFSLDKLRFDFSEIELTKNLKFYSKNIFFLIFDYSNYLLCLIKKKKIFFSDLKIFSKNILIYNRDIVDKLSKNFTLKELLVFRYYFFSLNDNNVNLNNLFFYINIFHIFDRVENYINLSKSIIILINSIELKLRDFYPDKIKYFDIKFDLKNNSIFLQLDENIDVMIIFMINNIFSNIFKKITYFRNESDYKNQLNNNFINGYEYIINIDRKYSFLSLDKSDLNNSISLRKTFNFDIKYLNIISNSIRDKIGKFVSFLKIFSFNSQKLYIDLLIPFFKYKYIFNNDNSGCNLMNYLEELERLDISEENYISDKIDGDIIFFDIQQLFDKFKIITLDNFSINKSMVLNNKNNKNNKNNNNLKRIAVSIDNPLNKNNNFLRMCFLDSLDIKKLKDSYISITKGNLFFNCENIFYKSYSFGVIEKIKYSSNNKIYSQLLDILFTILFLFGKYNIENKYFVYKINYHVCDNRYIWEIVFKIDSTNFFFTIIKDDLNDLIYFDCDYYIWKKFFIFSYLNYFSGISNDIRDKTEDITISFENFDFNVFLRAAFELLLSGKFIKFIDCFKNKYTFSVIDINTLDFFKKIYNNFNNIS